MNTKLIQPVLKIARQAGKDILSCRDSGLCISQKSNKTKFTQADLRSNQIITQALSKLTPTTPILSEENNINHSFDTRKKWTNYWLIDPLDGTKNFIDNSDEFCINIAYISDHRPIFGVIYTPVKQTFYYAHKKLGAFVKNQNHIKPLITKPAHIPLRILIGSYSSDNPKLKQHLNTYENYQLKNMGSALKFAYIAEGKYDYYPRFGKCYEWDTAAGVCILENAGGKVITKNNQPLSYNQSPQLLSPIFFASGS